MSSQVVKIEVSDVDDFPTPPPINLKSSMEFIDEDSFPSPPPPIYLRQLAFQPNMCRALWQDDCTSESDNGYSSDDDEITGLKEEETLPNVYFNLENTECVADGICCECKLPRKIEELHQSGTNE